MEKQRSACLRGKENGGKVQIMKRILAVDDDLATLSQFHAQLENHYDVLLAKSGEQALEICLQEPPDLILLDVTMPDMDGLETIAAIKKKSLLNPIPVIFITASPDVAVEVMALKSGAVDFITKPVEQEILLHRVDLHLRLSAYQQYLEKTVRDLEDSIINSFSSMIEYHNEDTGGHVTRTARYVSLLGRVLQEREEFATELPDHVLDLIARAAPLHDVGKIGVSDVILLKPAMLDDEEFAIMKTHTSIGASMLQNMHARTPQHYLKYAILIAESHHERHDGKGYPKGLEGDDIPLCARMMAVAD
ncbi:MAG: response regulator, partial [Burkholderiaceae bacterium]|nr:response regulator [Burkholderiaceae bacterium]